TLVLPSRKLEAPAVRAGGETLGLRCPDHPLTLEVLQRLGRPVAAPSANRSGEPSPKTAQAVLDVFDGRIDAVLDGGPCELGRESTVLDMSAAPYRILRQGALPAEDIAGALRDALTVVGLTGGSGSGKTTALRCLEELGALILDADQIYHELTVGSAAMQTELTARFGPVYRDGALDRRALAAVVFSDPAALADLNRITHKYVQDEIEARLRAHAMAGGTLAAIDAIELLNIEAGRRTWPKVAVTAPVEDRVRRLMVRDSISAEAARARIAAQHSDEWFREHCDHVLVNDGDRAGFEQTCKNYFTEVLGRHA
ncbi:MAG: dephospho-CoA kinase, partial [Oscillospiraceae bacterium]|nr:dephospho-CoA kinase [Oscillospiraceae bacterium]